MILEPDPSPELQMRSLAAPADLLLEACETLKQKTYLIYVHASDTHKKNIRQ